MVACWQLLLEFMCGIIFTAPINAGITAILGAFANPIFNLISEVCRSTVGAFSGGR